MIVFVDESFSSTTVLWPEAVAPLEALLTVSVDKMVVSMTSSSQYNSSIKGSIRYDEICIHSIEKPRLAAIFVARHLLAIKTKGSQTHKHGRLALTIDIVVARVG